MHDTCSHDCKAGLVERQAFGEVRARQPLTSPALMRRRDGRPRSVRQDRHHTRRPTAVRLGTDEARSPKRPVLPACHRACGTATQTVAQPVRSRQAARKPRACQSFGNSTAGSSKGTACGGNREVVMDALMTTSEVAKLLRVSKSTVCRWRVEGGVRTCPWCG